MKVRRPFAMLAAMGVMGFGYLLVAVGGPDNLLDPTTPSATTPQPSTASPDGTTGGALGAPTDDVELGGPSTVTVPTTTTTPPTTFAEPEAETVDDGAATVPSETVPVWDGECDSSDPGLGAVMRSWGNEVLLPYANGWPTNDPGTPVDCAPRSQFGAAITGVHSLYLDALAPEHIPQIAVEGASTSARVLLRASNTRTAETIGLVCEPLGWNTTDADGTRFVIYHHCDGTPLMVTEIEMRWDDKRGWLLVYDPSAQLKTDTASAGTAYYPFAAGD